MSVAPQSDINSAAKKIVHAAIKRHAGLSSFDDEPVQFEVDAIFRALKRNGFIIQKVL